MTWIKFSDGAFEEGRWDDLGPDMAGYALGLHAAAIGWSNRTLAGGAIPKARALGVFPVPDPQATVNALLEAGFWEDEGGTYRIVADFEHQDSAEDVQRRRDERAQRMRRWRANRNASRNTSRDDSLGNVPSPPPYPNPEGIEGYREEVGGSAACAGTSPAAAATPQQKSSFNVHMSEQAKNTQSRKSSKGKKS